MAIKKEIIFLFTVLFALTVVSSMKPWRAPCSPNPCRNGGTCERRPSGRYKCLCRTGWRGRKCGRPGSRNFQFSFPNRTVEDYVSFNLSSSAPSLTAFTLCQWYKVGDQGNGGTLFSYALPDEDNELLLIDYSGRTDTVVFLLGGSRVDTGLAANDDQWHHLCATWENTAGSWNLTLDGALLDGGDGFKTGHEIESGGILILGQDQDEFGGGFEDDQSFFGEMFGVNLWGSVLSPEKIKSMSEGCFYPQEGDYLGWSVFKEFQVHGNVSIESPTMCSP